jgi:hypothetical protein
MVVYICTLILKMTDKRYFPPELLNAFLTGLKPTVKQTIIGNSINGLPIHQLQLGSGTIKVLMWSQMHGNETTTTKALVDFIPWLLEANQASLLTTFSFFIIPQLNPDGAKVYTRENANGIDLNRDAQKQTEPESKALSTQYRKIQPDFALNLHGQRTIYGAGKQGNAASLSFLAPAADNERSLTPARERAMKAIAAIYRALEDDLPQGIGRYDDSFNPNCVGDAFTQAGTPTILFEAGHYPNDYQREISRKFIYKSFKALFLHLYHTDKETEVTDYFRIPENTKNFVDIILSLVTIEDQGNLYKNQQLAVQYHEELKGGVIELVPAYHCFGSALTLKAHRYIDATNLNLTFTFSQDELIKNPEFYKLFSLIN